MRTVGVLRALHAFLVKPPTVFLQIFAFFGQNGDRYRFPEAHSAKNGGRRIAAVVAYVSRRTVGTVATPML